MALSPRNRKGAIFLCIGVPNNIRILDILRAPVILTCTVHRIERWWIGNKYTYKPAHKQKSFRHNYLLHSWNVVHLRNRGTYTADIPATQYEFTYFYFSACCCCCCCRVCYAAPILFQTTGLYFERTEILSSYLCVTQTYYIHVRLGGVWRIGHVCNLIGIFDVQFSHSDFQVIHEWFHQKDNKDNDSLKETERHIVWIVLQRFR